MAANSKIEHRERPILFSGPMVRAILEDRKTQTRRIIKGVFKKESSGLLKGQPERLEVDCIKDWDGLPSRLDLRPRNWEICPYGVPGDRLWVRETWDAPDGSTNRDEAAYRADYGDKSEPQHTWRPSIHMPRWASRLSLELTESRIERVQDITAKDILAEGVVIRSHDCEAFARVGANPKCHVSAFDGAAYPDLMSLWAATWEKVNGKFAWARNDWVWVLNFKRVRQMPEVVQ